MSTALQNFRKENPEYDDMSDQELADGLHRVYYSHLPVEDFYKRIGLKTEPPKNEQSKSDLEKGTKDTGEPKSRSRNRRVSLGEIDPYAAGDEAINQVVGYNQKQSETPSFNSSVIKSSSTQQPQQQEIATGKNESFSNEAINQAIGLQQKERELPPNASTGAEIKVPQQQKQAIRANPSNQADLYEAANQAFGMPKETKFDAFTGAETKAPQKESQLEVQPDVQQNTPSLQPQNSFDGQQNSQIKNQGNAIDQQQEKSTTTKMLDLIKSFLPVKYSSIIGQRAVNLAGDFLRGSATLGDASSVDYQTPSQDMRVEYGKKGNRETIGEAYPERNKAIRDFGKVLSDFNLGVERTTNEDIKKSYKETGLGLDTIGITANWIAETGVETIPDMIAMTYALPAYIISRSQNMGDNRAKNKGKESGDINDMLEAVPFVIGSVMLDKFGMKGWSKAFTENLAKDALKAGFSNAAKRVAKAAGHGATKEGITEFLQEGFVEYLGEKVGTKEALDIWEALERGGWGALAGSALGGGMGAAGRAYKETSNSEAKQLSDAMNDEVDSARYVTDSELIAADSLNPKYAQYELVQESDADGDTNEVDANNNAVDLSASDGARIEQVRELKREKLELRKQLRKQNGKKGYAELKARHDEVSERLRIASGELTVDEKAKITSLRSQIEQRREDEKKLIENKSLIEKKLDEKGNKKGSKSLEREQKKTTNKLKAVQSEIDDLLQQETDIYNKYLNYDPFEERYTNKGKNKSGRLSQDIDGAFRLDRNQESSNSDSFEQNTELDDNVETEQQDIDPQQDVNILSQQDKEIFQQRKGEIKTSLTDSISKISGANGRNKTIHRKELEDLLYPLLDSDSEATLDALIELDNELEGGLANTIGKTSIVGKKIEPILKNAKEAKQARQERARSDGMKRELDGLNKLNQDLINNKNKQKTTQYLVDARSTNKEKHGINRKNKLTTRKKKSNKKGNINKNIDIDNDDNKKQLNALNENSAQQKDTKLNEISDIDNNKKNNIEDDKSSKNIKLQDALLEFELEESSLRYELSNASGKEYYSIKHRYDEALKKVIIIKEKLSDDEKKRLKTIRSDLSKLKIDIEVLVNKRRDINSNKSNKNSSKDSKKSTRKKNIIRKKIASTRDKISYLESKQDEIFSRYIDSNINNYKNTYSKHNKKNLSKQIVKLINRLENKEVIIRDKLNSSNDIEYETLKKEHDDIVEKIRIVKGDPLKQDELKLNKIDYDIKSLEEEKYTLGKELKKSKGKKGYADIKARYDKVTEIIRAARGEPTEDEKSKFAYIKSKIKKNIRTEKQLLEKKNSIEKKLNSIGNKKGKKNNKNLKLEQKKVIGELKSIQSEISDLLQQKNDIKRKYVNYDYFWLDDNTTEQNSYNTTEQNIGNLKIHETPLNELTLSKDVPQFKSDADKNGIVDKLEGIFDRTGVAPIQVWVRSDGRKEVISGRHRLDLARRSGEKTIPAQYHYEKDGFDKTKAASLDATLNIRDGQGKVKDYVQFFISSKISKEDAKSRGVLGRDKERQAYSIANEGSELLIYAHRADEISDRAAAEIAKAAPNDERLQAVGIKAIQDGKSDDVAVDMVRAVKFNTTQQKSTGDMFGFDDSAVIEAEKMAKLARGRINDINKEIAAIKGAGKNPSIAKKYGIDVNDPESIMKKISALEAEKKRWSNWFTNQDLANELRVDANRQGSLFEQSLLDQQKTTQQHKNSIGNDLFSSSNEHSNQNETTNSSDITAKIEQKKSERKALTEKRSLVRKTKESESKIAELNELEYEIAKLSDEIKKLEKQNKKSKNKIEQNENAKKINDEKNRYNSKIKQVKSEHKIGDTVLNALTREESKIISFNNNSVTLQSVDTKTSVSYDDIQALKQTGDKSTRVTNETANQYPIDQNVTSNNHLQKIADLINETAGYIRNGKAAADFKKLNMKNLMLSTNEALQIDRQGTIELLVEIDKKLEDIGGLIKTIGPRTNFSKMVKHLLDEGRAKSSSTERRDLPIAEELKNKIISVSKRLYGDSRSKRSGKALQSEARDLAIDLREYILQNASKNKESVIKFINELDSTLKNYGGLNRFLNNSPDILEKVNDLLGKSKNNSTKKKPIKKMSTSKQRKTNQKGVKSKNKLNSKNQSEDESNSNNDNQSQNNESSSKKAKGKNHVPLFRETGYPERKESITIDNEIVKIPNEVQRKEEIIHKLIKMIGRRLYYGKIRGKGIMGFYDPNNSAIRTRYKDDIEILGHEVAHYLEEHDLSNIPDFKTLYSTPKYRQQVADLSYTDNKDLESSEGFAEFVRLWLTNSSQAKHYAPDFYDAFNKLLSTNKKLNKHMKGLRVSMHRYYFQGATAIAESKIGVTKTWSNKFDDALYYNSVAMARQKLIDSVHAARKIEYELTGKINSAENSAWKMFRLANGGSESIADYIINYGTVRISQNGSTEKTGDGLKQILTEVDRVKLKPKHEGMKKIDLLLRYFTARRAEELMEQGRENLFSTQEIDEWLELGVTYPRFQLIHAKYQAFNNRLMDFYEEMGLVKPENRKQIEEMNKNYIPFFRVRESINGGNGSSVGSVGKRLYGGSQNIDDLLPNIMDGIVSNVKAAMTHRAKVIMYKNILSHQDGSLFATEIPADVIKQYIDETQMKKKITDALLYNQFIMKEDPDARVSKNNPLTDMDGNPVDLDLDIDGLLEFWKVGVKPTLNNKGNIVDSVMIDGKTRYFEVQDPVLIDMLMSINPTSYPKFINWMFTAKRWFTKGITMGFEFMGANLVRDTVGATFISKNNFKPFIDTFRGMYSYISKDKYYQDAMRSGLMYSSRLHGENKETQAKRKIGIDEFTYTKPMRQIFNAFEQLANAIEYGTRLGEFRLAKLKGKSDLQAAFEAREISTDFSAVGSSHGITAYIRTVPFLNAAIQSQYRLLREATLNKAHDGRVATFALKAFFLVTVPSLALQFLLKDDEEYKKRPESERRTNWHVPIGNGQFVKVPKPYDVGFHFATVPELMFEYLFSQKINGAELADGIMWIIKQMYGFSSVPAFATGALDVATNRDWAGRTIRPPYLDKLKPSEQYTARTSETFVKLGEKTGLSPIQAEHWYKASTGYLGGYTLWAADAVLWDKNKYGEMPDMAWEDRFYARRFITAKVSPSDFYTQKFYDLKARSDELYLTFAEQTSNERILSRKYNANLQFKDDKFWGFSANQNKILYSLNDSFKDINSILGSLRDQEIAIRYNPKLTGEQKRSQTENIWKNKSKILRNYYVSVKKALDKAEKITKK